MSSKGFGELIERRWFLAQPPDIQDYLRRYAMLHISGRQLKLIFENCWFAKVIECQAHRLVQPNGLPKINVDLVDLSLQSISSRNSC
jgi:hypothetical protein